MNSIKTYIIQFIAIASVFLFQSGVLAGSTNTAEIVLHTGKAAIKHPSSNCLNYKEIGICNWLSAITQEPIVTPWVSHYYPDAVVSAFSESGKNAWLEAGILDEAFKLEQDSLFKELGVTSAGGGQHTFSNALEQNTFFKEVDILGYPGISEFKKLLGPFNLFLLNYTAHSMSPYFISMLDSLVWRGFPKFSDVGQAYALTQTLNSYVGTNAGATIWGLSLPIEGKVLAANDAKASAVIAQRAANLLTTNKAHPSALGHVYQNLSTDCGKKCDIPIIKQNDQNTKFQRVYPLPTSTCEVFGENFHYGESDFDKSENKGLTKKSEGAYVWVLWRKYEGCVQPPVRANFVGRVERPV